MVSPSRSRPPMSHRKSDLGIPCRSKSAKVVLGPMATTIDNRRETVSLIGSDKVGGTALYGADDQKIGSVQRVMIDKISGKVSYAVISFGGFMGMGEDYYPMPWASLKYDTNLGGYRVGVTEDQLKGAPKYNRNTEWDWSDR